MQKNAAEWTKTHIMPMRKVSNCTDVPSKCIDSVPTVDLLILSFLFRSHCILVRMEVDPDIISIYSI